MLVTNGQHLCDAGTGPQGTAPCNRKAKHYGERRMDSGAIVRIEYCTKHKPRFGRIEYTSCKYVGDIRETRS